MSDYTDQVRGYLAYCRSAIAQLEARGWVMDPKYHPSADGCVKFIPHNGTPAEARKIREAFRELTGEAA